MSNTADQNLRNSQWMYGIRFVLDRDTTMYRWFSQMKPGRHRGTSMVSRAHRVAPAAMPPATEASSTFRLVSINADGTPNLSNVLAQETVDPRTRYFATKSAYGVSGITLFWYFNMGGYH